MSVMKWPLASADVINPSYFILEKNSTAVLVTRSAVQNAASIAAMILATDASVTEVPEKEKAPAAPPMLEY